VPLSKQDLDTTVTGILERRKTCDSSESLLVGVSGIDGAGKGFLSDLIVQRLLDKSVRAVVIHGDAWLNLGPKRFNASNPGPHFYENALRMDEMFETLVLPLKKKRSLRGIVKVAEETAESYRVQPYVFENVDIIILECIFLFKRSFRRHVDYAVWVECSFETALERALHRRQENLSEAETIQAYETIYFPAQKIHLDTDHPRETADLILNNS
jgi:uridine kinase